MIDDEDRFSGDSDGAKSIEDASNREGLLLEQSKWCSVLL